MPGHASGSDSIWRAFLSPNEDTGAERDGLDQGHLATSGRPPTTSLKLPTTQLYPDNTRILSAPVTGETPLRRVDGGEDELLLVDLLDFMASRQKGGIISFVFELNFGLLTNLLSGLAPLTQFFRLQRWMS